MLFFPGNTGHGQQSSPLRIICSDQTFHNYELWITPTNRKRPDRILSQCIADVQLAVLTIANQILPLVQRVRHRFVGQAILGYPANVLLQPLLQVIENRYAECLPCLFFLVLHQILDRRLYRVQFADLAQRHVGLGRLTRFLPGALGLGRPGGFNKLAPGMGLILSSA